MAKSIINEGVPDTEDGISAINVTSLVDVMFCLLIMFMVATPLMAPEAMQDVMLPAGRGEEIEESEFLYAYIVVDRQGKVFLGSLPLADDPAKLKEQLKANVKLKEDGMVFVQGDQNADFSKIVDVLVALKEAEITKVGFVTDPNAVRLREGGT